MKVEGTAYSHLCLLPLTGFRDQSIVLKLYFAAAGGMLDIVWRSSSLLVTEQLNPKRWVIRSRSASIAHLTRYLFQWEAGSSRFQSPADAKSGHILGWIEKMLTVKLAFTLNADEP